MFWNQKFWLLVSYLPRCTDVGIVWNNRGVDAAFNGAVLAAKKLEKKGALGLPTIKFT